MDALDTTYLSRCCNAVLDWCSAGFDGGPLQYIPSNFEVLVENYIAVFANNCNCAPEETTLRKLFQNSELYSVIQYWMCRYCGSC